MGADLLGYTVVRPADKVKHTEIAAKQIKEIETILSGPGNDEFKVKELLAIGVSLSFSHDVDSMSDAEYVETVRQLVDEVSDVSDLDLPYRDVNSRFAKVRGTEIEILFAGEMSWGDEPDGTGYTTLRTFTELGITDAWEKALN